MSRFVLAICLLGACTFSTSGVAGDDVAAIDASVIPDGDIVPDGIDPDSEPACLSACNGDMLVTCSGGDPVETTCPLGCSITGTPHCAQMVPSNLPDTADLDGVTGAITFGGGDTYTVFTDTGEIQDGNGDDLRAAGASVGGTTYRQINAGLAVLAVDTFTIEPDAVVLAYGNRALIVLARGAVQVHGYVDFSAGCSINGAFTPKCGGPGAGNGGDETAVAGIGCAGGTGGANGGNETGGAGGGFATKGGNAGGAMGKTTPLAAEITGCPGPTLIPLTGGSGGGAGAPNGTSVGGGGGGALQVSSLTSITIGALAAPERPMFYMAGGGGTGTNATSKGGGGGGAGGALLLEAPAITVFDVVVITGGGGGGGGRTINQDGDWGPIDGSTAPGGAGDPAGAGGTGANATTAATDGGGNTDGTGGGGGGVGRLRINDPDGVFTLPNGATVSAISSVGSLALE